MTLIEGELVDGKYRVRRKIGEGGMGAVFEAENLRISRRVAIKTLNASAAARPEMIERFEREAQAAGRIGNDHILEVLDLGSLPDGDRYIVMEFLEGDNLGDRIKSRGAIDARVLAGLIAQVCDGLQAAHDAGIIHRDLKPDNIFLVHEKAGIADYVKIIDFGISKFQQLSSDMSMTRTGTLMGTPYYMSPEQARGARGADHRTDIYALGVIMFEALVGEVPFAGETFNELMFNIVLAEPPSLQAKLPNLDPTFGQIVAQAMNREAALRFPSAKALGEALTAWLARGPSGTAVIPHLNLPGGTAVMAPVPQANLNQPAAAAPQPGVASPHGNIDAPAQTISAIAAPTPQLGGAGAATTAGISLSGAAVTPPKRSLLGPLLIGGFALLVVGGAGVGLLIASRQHASETAAAPVDAGVQVALGADAAPADTAQPADAGAAPNPSAAAAGSASAADAAPAPSTSDHKPQATPPTLTQPQAVAGKPAPKPEPKPEPAPKPKPKPGGGYDFGY